MSLTRGNDLALAMRLADAADSITLARYQSLDLVVTTKPDNTPVTDADKASEEAIRALLKSHRPDDGIVGEEFGEDAAGAQRYWVIDPIDGTKNFLRGVPTWATLIGLIGLIGTLAGIIQAVDNPNEIVPFESRGSILRLFLILGISSILITLSGIIIIFKNRIVSILNRFIIKNSKI